MLKKIPYKVVALSTLLTITATTLATPSTTVFANGIEQSTIENGNLSANTDKMKQTLKQAGDFAQTMNLYSYQLLHTPDVNFTGIDVTGYSNLPKQIAQDQKNARAHATTWDTKVKRQLLDTLTGIITYDTTFDNYYSILVDAAKTGDKETLKEGITDLQGDIQNNKKQAVALIGALQSLRAEISTDSRAFQTNAKTLSSILKNQTTGIVEDEEALQKVLEQVNRIRQARIDDIKFDVWHIVEIAIGGGGSLIKLVVDQSQLAKLEPLLAQLTQTVDYKKTLIRVVGVASNSVGEMSQAIDSAVKELQYMADQWNDLDSQYAGVLQMIDKADEKVTTNKYRFLTPTLNAAKDSWKSLKTDAETLKEGLKELKIEPVNTQK
ncbi:HBL/NHE enterotoxin family protein [Bacillus toyonensis]|uniref:Hemolysin n=1 Tax=Bacillus toyonensis TaxID=155322 RepID=A0A2B5Y054_9BACI|nr:HBL/NHE enterotoxin family protein [Bacillus toyonensis]PGB02014.1 hemolysin [Bacillus toyonensis]PHD67974.1 hemolysin [Bacillus toyonensis]